MMMNREAETLRLMESVSSGKSAEIAVVDQVVSGKVKVIRNDQQTPTKPLAVLDHVSPSVGDNVLLLRIGKSINSAVVIGKF